MRTRLRIIFNYAYPLTHMKEGSMINKNHALRLNINLARATWGPLSKTARMGLEELTSRYALSVALGDIQYLEGRWYVTHSGLLRVANRDRCSGIRVLRMRELCDPKSNRWVFRAPVYKSPRSRGFVGFGDADPSNVSSLVHGAEMRVAETRAVNRALRKAYGIGICSIEEIGSVPEQSERQASKRPPKPANGNYGGPKVRDRLCQLIRQHQLDPSLVKAYATDFCGTKTLRKASREQVENFVQHLADWAEKDRNALLCQLNSYPGQKEGAACNDKLPAC